MHSELDLIMEVKLLVVPSCSCISLNVIGILGFRNQKSIFKIMRLQYSLVMVCGELVETKAVTELQVQHIYVSDHICAKYCPDDGLHSS